MATVESGQLWTLPSRKPRSRIDRMPRILPSGTGMLPTASAKRHTSSRTTAGRDLSSVQARRRSSEPQVVTAQLVDGAAAHQLHVAFDFGSEIFKRPFNAGLTRGRQSIQIKSPSRTRLRSHGKGLQDVAAAGDAAVANHIYSIADSIDDLGELVKRASRPVELTPAMIGHHDGGRADVHGTLCVRNAHDALEAELLSPFLADIRGVLPVHRLVEHRAEIVTDRY